MANRVEVGSDGGVFNQIADERHRHRAAYPDALIDRACELGGLAPGARVLEIGCGTGQLTRSLLAWGLRVTAVEPGEQLIARARDRLAGRVRCSSSTRVWRRRRYRARTIEPWSRRRRSTGSIRV